MNSHIRKLVYLASAGLSILFILCFQNLRAGDLRTPFTENIVCDPAVPSPEQVLGISIGTRPVDHSEILHYLEVLSGVSSRTRLFEIGTSHEGRKFMVLAVSSAENIGRLETIKENLAKLADPRRIRSKSEKQDLIEKTPAITWMMYNVHGNEISGTDAALELAYLLTAAQDSATLGLLESLVVFIDPSQNPDGRERTLLQLKAWRSKVSISDAQNIDHTGLWPYGRGNHYHFDLNRDWFILSQPETRARVRAITEWHPQLVVDAHEMGSFSTYFFNPPREPVNLEIHPKIKNWWKIYAADQAAAFDLHGWSYYTQESFDEWYPGYGSSLPYYHGAVSILYEQAGTAGSQVKRPEGTLLTFSEAVQHQLVSSLANLRTTAKNRKVILNDFATIPEEALSNPDKNDIQVFIIDPGQNPSRVIRLLETLALQGIEIAVAEEPFKMLVQGYMSMIKTIRSFPEGTYFVPIQQPLRSLVINLLSPEMRLTSSFLKTEKESLKKGRGTRMYEVGAWSMPLAYGVDAFMGWEVPSVKSVPFRSVPLAGTVMNNPKPSYGFLVDFRDDSAIDVLTGCFHKGFMVRCAEKAFETGAVSYSKGSLLLRLNENPETLATDILEIAKRSRTPVNGVNSALCEKGPDLGGHEFRLLAVPKIAVLTGPDIDEESFGALWHLLDSELAIPHSILNIDVIGYLDLRKYNVLVLPSGRSYKEMLGEKGMGSLKEWTSNGGTLIALGDAPVAFVDSTMKFSQVRLRHQVLKQLKVYDKAVEWEKQLDVNPIDSVAIWEGIGMVESDTLKKTAGQDAENLAEMDRLGRLYMPRGAILKAELNRDHWLNYGLGPDVPAMVYTSNAYVSRPPVETAGRFSGAQELRLSGLVWPEAKIRWAHSTFISRESVGRGQLILFTGEPHYRSYFYGTKRILIHAMLLGPGFGTSAAVPYRSDEEVEEGRFYR